MPTRPRSSHLTYRTFSGLQLPFDRRSDRTVRGEERDGGMVHGVVALDASHAVHARVRLTSGADAVPGRVRLPGLDPARRYRVRAVDVLGREDVAAGSHAGSRPPAWTAAGGLVLPGSVLSGVGLPFPVLHPGEGLLVESSEEA